MTAEELRALAAALPGVSTEVACAGTPLESTSYRVGKKSFLFVGAREIRLKLGPSLGAAAAAGARPGAHGWVTCAVGSLPAAIGDWVRESHALAAPAQRRGGNKPS